MSIISTVPKGAAVEGINPNLLRNWYFLNPVNQRGATTGSIGYCIDGWNASYGSGGVTWSLTSNGLSFQPTNSSSYAYISQYIESAVLTELVGKTICVFALTSNGDLFGGRVSYAADITVYNNTYDGHRVQIRFAGNELRFESYASALTLVAVKFELGDLQTLAHQENSAWVLNEIPDYEYELYRCITSTADSNDTYANKTLATGQEIAYVEIGTTASRAYAAEEFFCWNGLLYQVITAIPSGASFTIGTNCKAVPGGGFNQLSSISIKVLSNWRYNANLDNYLSPGVFWIASGAINSPSTNPWCPLLVLPRGTSSPDTAMQVMFLDGYISTRRLASGTWTEWKTVTLA